MDVLHIEQLFYYWRCPFSGLELHVRYGWQVMPPNMYCSLLPMRHFVQTNTHISWKLQAAYGRSTYWMTALLSEIFVLWFRAAWEIWLDSYGPRNILQLFTDTFVHTASISRKIKAPATLLHSNRLQCNPGWLFALKVAKQSWSANYGPVLRASLFGMQLYTHNKQNSELMTILHTNQWLYIQPTMHKWATIELYCYAHFCTKEKQDSNICMRS